MVFVVPYVPCRPAVASAGRFDTIDETRQLLYRCQIDFVEGRCSTASALRTPVQWGTHPVTAEEIENELDPFVGDVSGTAGAFCVLS
jgi:hypothetical protein